MNWLLITQVFQKGQDSEGTVGLRPFLKSRGAMWKAHSGSSGLIALLTFLFVILR